MKRRAAFILALGSREQHGRFTSDDRHRRTVDVLAAQHNTRRAHQLTGGSRIFLEGGVTLGTRASEASEH